MSVPLIIPPTSPLLQDANAVILDATWFLNQPSRNAEEEFTTRPRLPRARFWDLVAVSEPHPRGFPIMLPGPERFAAFAGEHGIRPDSHVIVYDTLGVFSAPRTAWTFKVYGHDKVSVVDGGLPKAVADGVELETGPPRAFEKTTYPVPTLTPGAVIDYDEVLQLAGRDTPTAGAVIADARPRPAYEAGHIRTSYSLDFPSTLLAQPEGFFVLSATQEGGFNSFRDTEGYKQQLRDRLGDEVADDVLSGRSTVVNTCGGGISACINWLQLKALGVDSRVYDESWAGYKARDESLRALGAGPT